jgi:hypothetical protein
VGAHSLLASYGSALPSTPTAHLVGKAPLTVTADPKTITYGQPLPTDLTTTVTGTGSGLLTGTAACVLSGAPTAAGTYDDAITCTAGTLDVANFAFTFLPGDLTIEKASATVTANPITMTAGEALPAVTGTVTGLLGTDTLNVTCAGPSPLPTAPGTYPGALTCLADALNYAITLVPGALTVLAPVLGPIIGGTGGGTGGGGTTTNTTNNVTNVGIVGGSGGGAVKPKAPTLSLLTKKLKRTRKARLKLRSTGAITKLKLALKRNGKTVGKGSIAALNGNGSVTVKASKKLKKGLYTLQATWAGGGKKRFSIRVR